MKAAVLRETNKPLTIEEVLLDRPGPREVIVRTGAAGLCHSDLSVMNGTISIIDLPAVLGHESAWHGHRRRPRRHLRAAGRPRDHLPVAILRAV